MTACSGVWSTGSRRRRMREVRLLDETYETAADFGPDAVIGDALVSLEDRDDGVALAVLRATLGDRGRALELVPWLMIRGDAVEVLEPVSVRQDVADGFMQAVRRYGG